MTPTPITILTILFLCFGQFTVGQQLSLVSPLTNTIHETSGLVIVNDKLITHNDSGGDPYLYEIDSLTGSITRTVVVANAFNTDWEDITSDGNYIYLGDFGNNSGSRTDLKLFRVSISDYMTTPNDTVFADTTFFDYADQTDFTPTSFQTNYDAEAIIAFGDSLYIFSKNWGNGKSYIYPISKLPGTYSLHKKDSIDTQGQVTAATYNSFNNSIMLTGYSGLNPFLFQLSQFTGDDFANGHTVRTDITPPGGYSPQIEAIACFNSDYYYLSAEDNFAGNSGLFSLKAQFLNLQELEKVDINVFPNPSKGRVQISIPNNIEGIELLQIYALSGELVTSKTIDSAQKSDDITLNLNDQDSGLYIVSIITHKSTFTKRFILTK